MNTAILTLSGKISKQIDTANLYVRVFVDFRKAIDVINHDILLNK